MLTGYLYLAASAASDSTGRLGQFNRFNGVNDGYSTYGYDVATGSVLAVKDNAVFANVGHYVADRTFTWDDAGNVLSASAHATHPDEQTQLACYTYDGLRQLTRAWTPDASAGCASAPSAGGLAGPAPYWLEYAYDNATGNRTGVVAKTPTGGSTSSTFAYPAAGTARPHAVDTVTGGAGAGSYGYDQAGNQTTRPGQAVTYNEAGKVSQVVAGAETQQNVFDAEGNLLLRTSTTQGTALFLGDTTLTQAAGSTVVCGFRTYTGAEGKPVAQRSAKAGTAGSVLSWLFTSLDGTVDAQTNAATGATVHAYRDPFGAPAGASGQGWADSTGYLGKQVAEPTGLTNVGARTYDPVLGKFLSVDPVIDTTLPQQNTGYTYAGNNPTTYTDPTGLRLDEGCGWATTCKAAKARGATSTPKPKTLTELFFTPENIRFQKMLRGEPTQAPKPPTKPTVERAPNPYPWGPLITVDPNWKPPRPALGAGLQGCLVICVGGGIGADGTKEFSVSLGLRVEASGSVMVSQSEGDGMYYFGQCSGNAVVGAAVQVGLGPSGRTPADPTTAAVQSTASAGISGGIGGGCSVGIKWTWK